ncbi:MAG: 5'-methylthioadenosine/adenosylhomocysteine nucleosidase [Epulopiscium sp.]|nr:5'-methylthioadenosine/adenosylhomocysteine nucleosidase [Candidatus Epulonipiscium sp.]
MRKVGIIGAMDEEIIALKEKMEVQKVENVAGLEFVVGELSHLPVVLVRCGIGKVNAALCTQILISQFHIDAIINIGVAGALHPELKIGDVVISSDTIHHDFDASAFGDDIGVIPRMEESTFQADAKLIHLAKEAGKHISSIRQIYVARIVSGDQFIADKRKKDWIWRKFGAYCTEMEGAAIAHVCYVNEIPFVIIRSISDGADQGADMNFNQFVKLAAQNSSALIEQMLQYV